ncbi:O-antigen ligase family protein [Planctomycetota bacterium]
MKGYGIRIDIMRRPPDRLDLAIESLLVTLLTFMPFAFGAASAWSEEVVIAVSGMIVVCFLLKMVFHDDQEFVWTWAYVPLGLFAFFVVFQLVPLPTRFVNTISPNTVVLRQELLGDLPGAETWLRAAPLSFYPDVTRHDLRLIVSIAAVFIVAVNFFRRPEQIKRLLMAVALIGGAVAFIALAQNVFGNGKIYWFVSGKHAHASSGPFFNHNNYGQFMNLSIGAALGWIYVTLHEYFAARKVELSVVYDYLSSRAAKSIWLFVIVVAVGIATIFISLTRGGMVSLLIASAVMTLILVSRPSLKGRGWIMVIMALGAFACILFVGFDAVYDRFGTINDSQAYSIRWQLLNDLVASYGQFPLLGTGLGTHVVVYPMFKQINDITRYKYADNEYAQLLEEAGLVGLVILLIFGAIIFWSFLKNIRWAGLPIRSAAYGLGFGLLAILIQSFSDYGQHLPANAFLSAIFCALLVSLAHQNKEQRAVNRERTPRFRLRLSVISLLMMGVCGFWIWALISADRARRGEACWAKMRVIKNTLAKNHWHGSNAEFADLISGTKAMVEHHPGNVRYRYWHVTYRWHAISQTKDPQTGVAIISEEAMPEVRDIVEQLYRICFMCPLYGPPYSLAGQIEKFVLNNPTGAEKIRIGFRLAPSDPATCFAAARLDVLEGKTQESIPKFEKAVRLDRSLFGEVANIFVYQLSRPLAAISIAAEDIGRLSYVARVLDDMMYFDLAEQARGKIKGLLEAKCSEPDTSPSTLAQLGSIYSSEGNDEAAAECYRQALARNYGQIQWRMELAKLLARADKISEAMAEAKICLQLRPQLKAAKTLVEDLSVHPTLLAEKVKSR